MVSLQAQCLDSILVGRLENCLGTDGMHTLVFDKMLGVFHEKYSLRVIVGLYPPVASRIHLAV